MAGSTLDPGNIPPQRGRKTLKGHDVGSLGPSETSDSGQDMTGPGVVGKVALHLDRGTNEDSEAGTTKKIEAGKNVGDREMDDTSDAEGTASTSPAVPSPTCTRTPIAASTAWSARKKRDWAPGSIRQKKAGWASPMRKRK